MKNQYKIILAVVAAALFFFLVWPGLYIYSTNRGVGVRTNRITGVSEIGSGAGWEKVN